MSADDAKAADSGSQDDLNLVFLDERPDSTGELELETEIPSSLQEKEKAVIELLEHLSETAGFESPSDRIRTRMAIDEALMNAVIHGNDEDPDRSVSIELYRNEPDQSWSLFVEDEGDGFSDTDISTSDDPEVLVMEGGRGLMIIQETMDQFFYYDGGSGLYMETSYASEASGGEVMQEEEGSPELHLEEEGEVAVVSFSNARLLNKQAMDEISDALMAIPENRDKPNIVLDFSGVEYISSPTLGKLVQFHKRVEEGGGSLKIASIHPDIQEVFELTKLDMIFDLFDSREEAVEALQQELQS